MCASPPVGDCVPAGICDVDRRNVMAKKKTLKKTKKEYRRDDDTLAVYRESIEHMIEQSPSGTLKGRNS